MPRARSAATSAASPSSQSILSRPVSSATRSAEPIFTTTRRAAAIRAAELTAESRPPRLAAAASGCRTAAIAALSARSTSGTPCPVAPESR